MTYTIELIASGFISNRIKNRGYRWVLYNKSDLSLSSCHRGPLGVRFPSLYRVLAGCGVYRYATSFQTETLVNIQRKKNDESMDTNVKLTVGNRQHYLNDHLTETSTQKHVSFYQYNTTDIVSMCCIPASSQATTESSITSLMSIHQKHIYKSALYLQSSGEEDR